jgi:hypothetical protein
MPNGLLLAAVQFTLLRSFSSVTSLLMLQLVLHDTHSGRLEVMGLPSGEYQRPGIASVTQRVTDILCVATL